MDSLEANFPHLFPKPAPLQKVAAPDGLAAKWPPAPYKDHGDRGLASNEVIDPGNQVQCDQSYLEGLLFELKQVENAVILFPGAFEVPGHEPVQDQKLEPFAVDALINFSTIHDERMRLRDHPELFGDEKTRSQYLQRFDQASTRFDAILDGHSDAGTINTWHELIESLAEHEAAQSLKPKALRPSWETWCRPTRNTFTKDIPKIKEFMESHPDMILVGNQWAPHMGVLIAERWRKQVEDVVVGIATTRNPSVADQFPKREKMMSGTKFEPEGTYAVLRFTLAQPTIQQAGHVFAFGPRENVANMARILATLNADITRIGFPQALFMGHFMSREEAKKFPHLQPLL